MQDRKSTKSVEQAMKEAEQIVLQAETLEELEDSLAKAAEGMQFYKASIKFFHSDKRLGSPIDQNNPRSGKPFNGETENNQVIFLEIRNFQ